MTSDNKVTDTELQLYPMAYAKKMHEQKKIDVFEKKTKSVKGYS